MVARDVEREVAGQTFDFDAGIFRSGVGVVGDDRHGRVVGADDVDRVAAVDVNTLGRRRTALEEIRGNIKAAGLEPRERNARWEAMAS